MNITKDGLKKPSQNELSLEDANKLIQSMTLGADLQQIGGIMEDWSETKKSKGWELAAEYFQECANFNPKMELGKSMARLNLLFRNSAQIQDYKTCLSIQKELNKILKLHAR